VCVCDWNSTVLSWDLGVCFSQGLKFDFLWCQFWWVSPYIVKAKKKTLSLYSPPANGRWNWSPQISRSLGNDSPYLVVLCVESMTNIVGKVFKSSMESEWDQKILLTVLVLKGICSYMCTCHQSNTSTVAYKKTLHRLMHPRTEFMYLWRAL
jgi:hypothetical protein